MNLFSGFAFHLFQVVPKRVHKYIVKGGAIVFTRFPYLTDPTYSRPVLCCQAYGGPLSIVRDVFFLWAHKKSDFC